MLLCFEPIRFSLLLPADEQVKPSRINLKFGIEQFKTILMLINFKVGSSPQKFYLLCF